MLLFNRQIFEELMISGTTMYTDPRYVHGGSAKTLVFACLCRNLGSDASVTVQLETSFDGKHWLNVSASPEINDSTITVGAVNGKFITPNMSDLGNFVRLRVTTRGLDHTDIQIFIIGRGESQLKILQQQYISGTSMKPNPSYADPIAKLRQPWIKSKDELHVGTLPGGNGPSYLWPMEEDPPPAPQDNGFGTTGGWGGWYGSLGLPGGVWSDSGAPNSGGGGGSGGEDFTPGPGDTKGSGSPHPGVGDDLSWGDYFGDFGYGSNEKTHPSNDDFGEWHPGNWQNSGGSSSLDDLEPCPPGEICVDVHGEKSSDPIWQNGYWESGTYNPKNPGPSGGYIGWGWADDAISSSKCKQARKDCTDCEILVTTQALKCQVDCNTNWNTIPTGNTLTDSWNAYMNQQCKVGCDKGYKKGIAKCAKTTSCKIVKICDADLIQKP
jgi:hypothetical protein